VGTVSRLFLAIDGGNSKTDAVVGTEDGELLAHVRGPGSCYQVIGLPAARAVLDDLAREAVIQAGLAPGTVLDHAEVYLAGADLPAEVELLTAAVTEAGWAKEYQLDNDLFAILRAGTAAPDAVAVVCGAGTNCVGRRADGASSRFPALGEISGDWGGGVHLARLALWHAVRGEDGRGPATALSAAVAAHLGRHSVGDVVVDLHLGGLDRAAVHTLAPVLFEVARAGDPVAASLVARQVDEVVALATVAARRLDLLQRNFDVVLGGGVLTARHPQLHDGVVAGIAAVAPRARLSVLTDPPVAGAALLALDAWGATTPQREARLRAAIRSAQP
jgi:N-acetylglucosamine kinase-like BadF-type ATPase